MNSWRISWWSLLDMNPVNMIILADNKLSNYRTRGRVIDR